jgi:anaerobic C4-dicarboxylate transporter
MRSLWFALVLIVAFLLARFVGTAVGGLVGLVLAILVFYFVFRVADEA